MEFVSPIITPIVESLMVPIKKHLGFLVSSTKNVKEMDAKMKQLNDTAKEVQAKWDRAVGNTEVVPELVDPWMEDVKKLNEKSDNLKETTGCFNVAKRYKVGKQSYAILEEIKELENRESKIVFTHAQKPLAEVGSTSSVPSTSTLVPVPIGTQINFESRDFIFKKALQALQSNDESQKMIALCGMGGVGKTTMMKQLKKVVEDLNTFDLVVKVVIGENNDTNSLQQAIAQYLGNDLTESTKDARADRLQKLFEAKSQQGQKKILVIMDDLWNEVDLNDVGLSPLPLGFKMLLTSRFENVCAEMGVDLILNVCVLSKREAKTLFSKTMRPSPWDGDDVELQRIGKAIVMKCGGLPIAIVTIAKLLSGNTKEAWKKALWRLERDDLNDLKKISHRIFEMSYENLKEDDDRAIFLLCGLFPDDFDIRTEDLLRYGWGLSFYKDVETLVIARQHMKVCINNLIRANLLTESDINGCVKMHDLVRAFVLSNFSEVKQASIVNQKNMSVHALRKDADVSYERILLKCTDICELPIDFGHSNLSLLILMDGKTLKFPIDIYERMQTLKVVSYENLGIPLLPVMFEHSTKLRTIRLRSCLLIDSDISFLGSLHNLEILSLVDCNIRRLPSTIGHLKKLKLLDLIGCIDLHIDDGVIQNLDSLEELSLRASKGRVVRFTHANCEELQKISHRLFVLELEFIAWPQPKQYVSRQDKPQLKNMSFKNLERFKISIGCELEMEHLEDYSFINKLNLITTCEELSECNIRNLFEKTEELKLEVNDMYNIEDISVPHTFCRLRVFHVSNCANLTCLFTPDVASGLKKLERLKISKCPVLKALVSKNSGVAVIKFQKLNVMSLEDLPKMLTLCEDVIELPELVELKLCGLPNFTSIYHDNRSDMSVMQPLLNKEVIMPKLEKLDISKMGNLKQIWPCEISNSEKNDVSMLRRIRVWRCDSLVNIFPSNPLPLLNHLEELEVKKCGSIEVLFNIDFECVSGMEEYNSRLKNIKVEDLGKINELWRIRGVNNSDVVINGFKGVEKITIANCQKLTNIFTPITANFDLGALTTYKAKKIGCDVKESYRQNKSLVKGNKEVNLTYPTHLLHICHHLKHLELCDDNHVEVVFEMNIPSSHKLPTIQDGQPPLLLPYLEVLDLYSLTKMSHVWKCNWNKFFILHHPPLQLPFQNLTKISLRYCHKMKYLFSPLMAKYLSNLKKVYIGFSDGIEEVISNKDDENEENTTSTSSHQNTTFFPHLDSCKLSHLSRLKRVDGGDQTRSESISSDLTIATHGRSQSGQVIGACWSLCQYPRSIGIDDCYTLSSLVPWYSVGQMKKLETLFIDSCEKMKEIFESEPSTNKLGEVSSHIGPTIKTGPTLVVPQLSNLKRLCINNCGRVSHVFTFSTLESLSNLKTLIVKRCKAILVIIKEENITSSNDAVVFPRLETLILDNLPLLKGFFLGMNEFRWPLLDNVMINGCPQLTMFTCGESKTPKLKHICTRLGKHSLECGLNFYGSINVHQTTFQASSSSSDPTISKVMPWSFHNLVELDIFNTNVGATIIPSNVLLQLKKLEKIRVESCFMVKEVFEVVVTSEESDLNESQTTTLVQIPNLTQVNLRFLRLKYLWRSNPSMALEFPNLTTLSIYYCHELEHVFTCSMVGSLVQLQDLKISDCNYIEVIVKEEDDECDAKVNEIITLPRLKSLKLEDLPTLKGFCLRNDAFSLPALETLQIKGCGAINVFTKGDLSAPCLKLIDTDYGMYTIKGDLNSFIKTKQEENSSFEDDASSSEET